MTFPSVMKLNRRWNGALLFVGMALAVFALPACAELGGGIDSIKADQAKMNGTIQITPATGYEIHEIQSPQGTRVREYLSAGGSVFGVAWQGPWMPNLRQILGPYFDQYAKANQGKKATRGPVTIQLPGLVIECGGHPRSFVGRAYIPQMIPQGATADVIK
jgi:Protein of unknown function (DUF2844)